MQIPKTLQKRLMKLKFKLRKFYFTLRARVLHSTAGKAITRAPLWARASILTLGIGAVAFLVLVPGISGATPQTISLTREDFIGGTSDYGNIQLANNAQSLQLQSGVVGKWDTSSSTGVQNIPSLVDGITNLVYGPNDTMYLMTAFDRQCSFTVYNIAKQTWKKLNTPPIGCGAGTILEYDGNGSLYYVPGGSATEPSNRFFKYSISSNSWSSLANFPSSVANISSGTVVTQGSKQYLYIFRGMSSPSFWRYDINANSWENLPSFPTSGSVSNGIVIVWDQANSLYAIANQTGEFKRYDIVTNTWTNLTTVSGSTNMRHSLEYRNGNIVAMRLNIGSELGSLTSYNIATSTWSTLPVPPASNIPEYPLPFAYDGSRYGYTVMGAEIRPEMYRFDFANNTWNAMSLLSGAQDSSGYHQSIIYDGLSSIYFAGGIAASRTDRIYKYNTDTNDTTQIGSQFNTSSGYNGVHYNNALYLLESGGTTFQRYDLTTNTFTPLASLAYATGDGDDLVDGGDGYLYLVYGNNRADFRRYQVSTNTWTTLTSSPQVVRYGGGATRVGRSIYVLVGNSSSYFLKYDMDAGTWATMPSLPNGSVNYGAFITSDHSRYLYIGTSSRIESTTRKVYRYDTLNAEWLRIADLPASVKPRASAAFNTANNTLYVAQAQATSLLWKWNPVSTSYITSGTWYSKTYDLKQVQTWTSFNKTVTGPGTATFYTRTSSDSNIWSSWQQVSGNSIQSPTNRYMEFKVELASDGTGTPTVSGISFNYDQETASPNLPSQFTAKGNKEDSTTLTSGQTYEHQHPYFSWSGASDGTNGSGVDGYYVYFGTDSNADPAIEGSYQTSVDYTVSTPMIASEVYYLRIKVKDRLGNMSVGATYFSYRYFYISPPESVIKASTNDFTNGTNTDVAISDNAMKLRAIPEGAWSTGPVTMPLENTTGATMTVVGKSIYVARGTNSTAFWRYDTETQNWSTLASVPINVNSGSSMTYDAQGNLYLVVGNGSNGFYRYSIVNDSWTAIGTGLPSTAQAGTSITYIGSNKFLILFTGVREFYQYSSVSASFTPLTSYPTTITNSGSGIWFDGNDTLYTYLGAWTWDNARATRNSMASYSISADAWRILADPPVTSFNTQNNLVSDGQGNLYTFANTQQENVSKNQRMMRYNIASDSWFEVNGLEAEMYTGTATSDNERYIYLLPGGNGTSSRKMIRYDSWTGRFTPKITSIDPMERIPYDTVSASQWVGGNSSTAIYDGSQYIYALSGAEATSSASQLIKFDYKTGSTQYLPSPPLIGIGGSLSYINNTLYYLPGKSTREFYKYDDIKQQWFRMADTAAVVYRPGPSALVNTGSMLFAIRGNSTGLYRYTPDSGSGTWATMANAPGTILNGSAVYDASSNSIFVVAGNGTTNFYRYSVANNTWTTLTTLPGSSTYGSTMSISDGKIYVQRGNLTKTAYIYTISSNSWANGVDAPELFSYGANSLKVSNQTAVVFAGQNIPDIWKFQYPSATTAYDGQAIHISEPFMAQGIFDYAGVSAQVDLPENTYVELWTRSSEDSVTWNDWKIATDVKHFNARISGVVQSDAKRYTQVKVVLESDDNLYTPTVRSYAVNYYYDIDPPTNPSVLSVYSNTNKDVPLSNNIWYNYDKPLFDWPDAGEPGGPTDGPLGSNIAGYWVYIGTDPTASPRTQGVFVPASEYNPTLTIPGTYFVRLQTQDITGNVDPSIFAPFAYKFDKEPPSNPSLITVTPSGFTTQNNFSYSWPNAYDANSGVAGYCYHTGATSGPFAGEICQAGTSLPDVSTAYRSGTNVFYLRSYDNAGNYAANYTTVSYYYTTDPPGPVTNLRAIPPTSTQNMFAFAWDLPLTYSGDPNQMIYCYSINILPSPTNTTCSSNRFISAFKAATQQGTNIIYIVAKDEADNANWNNFMSANFIANTVSPGIPLNVVVADTSDRVTNRWSLTLTWDTPTFVGNGIQDYIIERSADGHAFTTVGNTSNRAYVDLDIQPETLYYYRIRAQDGVNNVGGASGIVSRSAQGYFTAPPEIVVPPAATSDFDQTRITWATSREASSFVYYGTAPNNLTQSKGSLDPVTAHSQMLTGLQPSTTYYYRVQSFDERRNYNLNDAYSDIASFRTAAAAQIEAVDVSDITSNSAVISWRTSIPTKARVSYGPTLDYGFDLTNEGDEVSTRHTLRLTDLPSGTLQHFKITSTTSFGSAFASDDYTFTTIARPIVSNVRFQPIEDGPTAAVQVVWTTNVPTSSTVYYTSTGTRLEVTKSELTTDHAVVLENLASNTPYEISVEGRDQYGNLGSSARQNWTSSIDTRPPQITEPAYNVTTTDAGRGKQAQLIISWKTDEPATSQIMYDKGTSEKLALQTPLNTEPTTNHVAIISNLNLADVYKVQIVSRDLDGNTTRGTVTTLVTPDRAVNVFDNVLDLMQRLFRV